MRIPTLALGALVTLVGLSMAVTAQPAWDPMDDGTCPMAGYCAPCPNPEATAMANGDIHITWEPNPRVVEWLVTRGTTENDTTEEVASLSGNVTEWTDTDTVPGVTYYYRLHGMSDSGLGGHCSDAISATATGPSPPQTEVPFFTSPLAIALATAGLVGAGFVLRRR